MLAFDMPNGHNLTRDRCDKRRLVGCTRGACFAVSRNSLGTQGRKSLASPFVRTFHGLCGVVFRLSEAEVLGGLIVLLAGANAFLTKLHGAIHGASGKLESRH